MRLKWVRQYEHVKIITDLSVWLCFIHHTHNNYAPLPLLCMQVHVLYLPALSLSHTHTLSPSCSATRMSSFSSARYRSWSSSSSSSTSSTVGRWGRFDFRPNLFLSSSLLRTSYLHDLIYTTRNIMHLHSNLGCGSSTCTSLVPRPFEGRRRKGLVHTVCACVNFSVKTSVKVYVH